MRCHKILELTEEYIMGELDEDQRTLVENHFRECADCRKEYEEIKALVSNIQNIKNRLNTEEVIITMNKKNIVNQLEKSERHPFTRFVPGIAACIFLVMFLFAGSILAFPSFASKYVPKLPFIKELSQAKVENNEIKQQIESAKKENEQLKIEIKRIKDVEVKEVTTSVGVPAAEDKAVQELVIDFIKAQYHGDINALKDMSTEEFKKQIDGNKQGIILIKRGEVIFTQITNVAKEGEKYLVFVRLNDSEEKDDADYQEDFEVVKVAGKYLVSFAGKDA